MTALQETAKKVIKKFNDEKHSFTTYDSVLRQRNVKINSLAEFRRTTFEIYKLPEYTNKLPEYTKFDAIRPIRDLQSALIKNPPKSDNKVECENYVNELRRNNESLQLATNELTTLVSAQLMVIAYQLDTIEEVNEQLINFPPPNEMLRTNHGGLLNIGSTCYAAALLQALFKIPLLQHWFKITVRNKRQYRRPPIVNNFVHQLSQFFDEVQTQQVVNPKVWYTLIQRLSNSFPLDIQHDAMEFMGTVLDLVFNEMKNESPFVSIFHYGYINVIKCLENDCMFQSTSFHHVNLLEVDVDGDADLLALIHKQLGSQKVLYQCPNCDKETSCDNRKYGRDLPLVLTILLKRFRPGSVEAKNRANITIPTFLDLQFFGSELSHTTFELLAMVNHVGPSATSGHYTTVVRSVTGKWIKYDDSTVKEIKFETIDMSQPYIVFYRRCTKKDDSSVRQLSY